MSTSDLSDTSSCESSQTGCPLIHYGAGSFPFAQPPDEKEINLLDLLRILLKRKTLIIGITVLAGIASIAYALCLPNIYTSSGTILPADEKGGSRSLLANLGGLGGLAGGLIGGGSSKEELWVSILKSRTVAEIVAKKFKLKEIYETKTELDAVMALSSAIKVSKSKKDNIITVAVEDRVPARAAKLAIAFIEELDAFNRKFAISSGRRMRIFLKKRLVEAEEELKGAEEELKKFQEENEAIKIDDQSKAIVSAIGTIKGEIMAKEIELKTLRSYASPSNPKVQITSEILKGLRLKLGQLVGGADTATDSDNNSLPEEKTLYIPSSKYPGLGLQYARLLRKLKIHQTLYEVLRQQFEMAKIQEAKDSPTVQVLDMPRVPENKSKPKRSLMVILATVLGFLGAIFLVFLLEYKDKLRAGGETLSGKTL